MTAFLVERYLPGWTSDEIGSLLATIQPHRAELDARHVRHLSSLVLSGEETCLCLFDAAGTDEVRAANAGLGLPIDRVVAAELTPGSP